MKSISCFLLFILPILCYGQTISIPATNIPFNPGTNIISVPSTVLTVNPTPDAPPLTRKELKAMKLHIISMEYKNGIHQVTGYNAASALVNVPVQFGLGGTYGVWTYTGKPKVAIVTIPFKMRGSVDTFPSKAISGLSNIGVTINFANLKLEKYFYNGNKAVHNYNIGIFLAPNVEEIAPETTSNYVAKKSSQLFVSTGLSITYSYGDVSFVAIPVGFDFGTTRNGQKYIYNGRYWWGFGIGVSAKFFGL